MGNCVTNVQREVNYNTSRKQTPPRPPSNPRGLDEGVKNKLSIPSSPKQAEFDKSLILHQNDEDEYSYLSTITHFDEDTLRLLHVRFIAIDASIERDSRISLAEFAKILQMSPQCILVSRFFKCLDAHDVGITFRSFARTMSILSLGAKQIEKVKLLFSLCDLDDDGYIGKNELFQIIKDCLPQLKPLILNDEQIQILVNQTFEQVNPMIADKISFLEYQAFVTKIENHRLLVPFSLDICKLIQYEADARKCQRLPESTKKKLHHGPLHLSVSPEKRHRRLSPFSMLSLPSIGKKVERVNSIQDIENWNFDIDFESEQNVESESPQ